MGQVLGGCHQVYVICPLVLETEENLAQFLSGHLPAEVPAADFMILAEAAAQGTAGKKTVPLPPESEWAPPGAVKPPSASADPLMQGSSQW